MCGKINYKNITIGLHFDYNLKFGLNIKINYGKIKT